MMKLTPTKKTTGNREVIVTLASPPPVFEKRSVLLCHLEAVVRMSYSKLSIDEKDLFADCSEEEMIEMLVHRRQLHYHISR